MTIRMLLAAALLVPLAGTVRAQGWGGDGADPNGPAAKSAPARAPEAVPKVAPKVEAPAPSPAPVKVKAKPAPTPVASASEFDEAGLERARAMVDKQLLARKAQLAGSTQRRNAYHMAMEKDSMDAERQMAEERKAFLLYLKSVPQEDRGSAMKNFDARQDAKRRDLDKRHLSQYKAWFDESIASSWRSQPLSAERVAVPETPVLASADAPAADVAAAEAPKPAARVKVKKRGAKKS